MTITEVVSLGLVQGLTEFLPVSSSGHLLAARFLFDWTDTEGTTFDAFLHLGTLVAVLVYYWRVWWGIGRGLFVGDTEGKDKQELLKKLAVTTIPGMVLGFLLMDEIEAWLRGEGFLALSLLMTAGVLYWFDRTGEQGTERRRANFKDAIYIGLAQAVALVPGISRSGMTIAAGRWRGLSRKQATHFSFLMSAPIIAGASLGSLANLIINNTVPGGQLVVGFLVSLISGLMAIHLLLKIVERISFKVFAVYLVVLAVTILMSGF